ncbi:MAG: F0F1 ATP synthase subunit A [Alphaproteobacteria bacterium]|nr:F0F1 ATP synthase subunit A [Alphaproteobacteria bacterium]TAD90103.1 MAG: F0F1 ATP synthase subunit A [Alphaproteobacteria bacterium]
MASPLEQFTIKPIVPLHIGSLDLSFTNSALMMTIAVGIATALFVVAMRQPATIPGRVQSMAELLYNFIADLLESSAGHEAKKYFPFVFSIFLFVLLGNLLGMIPTFFTYTSHIIVTLGLALLVFVTVTAIGFIRHGMHFFSFFLPAGAPLWLAPLLIPIEVLSYLSRPVSLSVRLFANMLAGHTMLKVFAGFAVSLGAVFGIAPLALIVALTGFEILVALLQAYVFSVLTCLYLKDAIDLH